MSAFPMIEELVSRPEARNSGDTQSGTAASPIFTSRISVGKRHLRVFDAETALEAFSRINNAADYSLEPNIFFHPCFCMPAMNRLGERRVQLLTLQDGDPDKPLTRFMMPFTIERPGFALGPSVMRAWVNPYGPYGVPVLERREATRIIDDLFATLAQPSLALPKILLLPHLPTDSRTVSLLRSVAMSNGLSVEPAARFSRPALNARADPDDYFKNGLSGRHRRNYARLQRQLEHCGKLQYTIARSPEEVRIALEEFMLLEKAGWKGKGGTALASDRYREAFAREAINTLAQRDKVRMHAFTLDNAVVASLIVFVEGNKAWTWKTAYDERLSQYSPGILLMMRATETMLDDPNILFADSCAVNNHPTMTRLWTERQDMVTLVIGMVGQSEKTVRQVASQLELYNSTRNMAKSLRDRVKAMLRNN